MNAVVEADRLSAGAAAIVERMGLMAIFGEYGRPCMVGSATFGLMVSRNLDFEVYTETPEARAGFEMMGRVASIPGVTGITYLNFMGTGDPGLYWKVDFTDPDGHNWDMDVWLVPHSHPHAGVAESLSISMNRVLTPELRETILAIKSGLSEGHRYRGIDIYHAVIGDGIRDLESFEQWMKSTNPGDAIDPWHP